MRHNQKTGGYSHPLKRFVMWVDWIWQEQNAIRYESRIRLYQKKIDDVKPLADFYREFANELREKLR